MRVLGLALGATLVGGALFGVRHLVADDRPAKGRPGAAKVGRRTPGAHATRLAGLLARVASADPDDAEPEDADGAPDDVDVAPAPTAHAGLRFGIEGIDEPDPDGDHEPLEAAADDDAPPVELHGWVVGPGELAGVTVSLLRGDQLVSRLTTDEAGRFTTTLDDEDARPDDVGFVLRAEADDGWQGEAHVARLDAPVRIALGTRLAVVSGTVVDGAGHPLAFVDVEGPDDEGLETTSTHFAGEFALRVPEGRRTTLRFVSFGLEVARLDVIARHDAPEVRVVARAGRSITCPLARLGRELEATGISASFSHRDGMGWGIGRGSSHGLELDDLTVVPGPALERIAVHVTGRAETATATIEPASGTCRVVKAASIE